VLDGVGGLDAFLHQREAKHEQLLAAQSQLEQQQEQLVFWEGQCKKCWLQKQQELWNAVQDIEQPTEAAVAAVLQQQQYCGAEAAVACEVLQNFTAKLSDYCTSRQQYLQAVQIYNSGLEEAEAALADICRVVRARVVLQQSADMQMSSLLACGRTARGCEARELEQKAQDLIPSAAGAQADAKERVEKVAAWQTRFCNLQLTDQQAGFVNGNGMRWDDADGLAARIVPPRGCAAFWWVSIAAQLMGKYQAGQLVAEVLQDCSSWVAHYQHSQVVAQQFSCVHNIIKAREAVGLPRPSSAVEQERQQQHNVDK
jgi:hypothetical protein